MRAFLVIVGFALLVGGFSTAAYVVYPEQVGNPINQMANNIIVKQNEIIVSLGDGFDKFSENIATYDDAAINFVVNQGNNISEFYNASLSSAGDVVGNAGVSASRVGVNIAAIPVNIWGGISEGASVVAESSIQIWGETVTSFTSFFDNQYNKMAGLVKVKQKDEIENIQTANNNFFANDATPVDILAGIETGAGGDNDRLDSVDEESPNNRFEYDVEENVLSAEAVLVPRAKTVISSSRDGQIKNIPFNNGDRFKKGDILLEYHCDDVKAEAAAADAAKKFASEKQLTTSRLFNMKLASKLEKEQARVEAEQTKAKIILSEQRLNDCQIRAGYDGRVVKKLANDGEYTRTDRVLMEVASEGTLDVEFLLPSRALRWVNIDAPLVLNISETGKDYNGAIKQIYGEVDPVSQSIQIRAGLDDYTDPLLPGMSGEISVNIRNIREAGISGFLETQTP